MRGAAGISVILDKSGKVCPWETIGLTTCNYGNSSFVKCNFIKPLIHDISKFKPHITTHSLYFNKLKFPSSPAKQSLIKPGIS